MRCTAPGEQKQDVSDILDVWGSSKEMKTIALEGAEYRFKEWNELSFSEFKRVLDLLWQISTAESDEDFGEPVGAFLNLMAPDITDLDKRTLAALFLTISGHFIQTSAKGLRGLGHQLSTISSRLQRQGLNERLTKWGKESSTERLSA